MGAAEHEGRELAELPIRRRDANRRRLIARGVAEHHVQGLVRWQFVVIDAEYCRSVIEAVYAGNERRRGCRRRIKYRIAKGVVTVGIVVEFSDIGRVTEGAAHEVGAGGPRKIQETETKLQGPGFSRFHAAGDVAQTQVEFQPKIVVARQIPRERMVKITVSLR